MTGAPFPLHSHLRLVPPEPQPRRRLSVRINALDGRLVFGRSCAFRLTHDGLDELIAVAMRMERRMSARRQVPLDFIDRMIAAYSAYPWTGYSAASVVHVRACAIRRGGGCTCTPEVFLKMPGGDLVEVDPAGRCKRSTRQ